MKPLITQCTLLLIIATTLTGCQGKAQKKATAKTYAVQKTEAEWKETLSEMAYYVLRQSGTERAFTGKYYKNYEQGVYQCVGCNSVLYLSQNKYDSGTGWPSFDKEVPNSVEYGVDYKLGYPRTELKCNTCGGHIGHLFNDGPANTTGKRHCINSAALNFIEETNE